MEIARMDAALPNGVKPPPKAPAKIKINHKKRGLLAAAGSSLISATTGINAAVTGILSRIPLTPYLQDLLQALRQVKKEWDRNLIHYIL